MVSSIFCTAALSCSGSIVPVQKEKAPDWGKNVYVFKKNCFFFFHE